MPDDTRTDMIERTINREITESFALSPNGGSVFTVAPRSMNEVMEFAKLMAVSGICIRPMFRGNPGACLAVTLQAMKWGADPFAVANKAFEVNGQLYYELQLVHAIVNSSSALAKRLDVTFSGQGSTRKCLVVGCIKGEEEGREYESPTVGEITTKNSPLWKTDPDQQLFYYATRAWARRWVPEVLLGIYTPDELTRTIDLVPAPEPRREDFVAVTAQPEPEEDDALLYTVIDLDGVEHTFREAANAEAALIAVLEAAAKMGLKRLEGALDSQSLVAFSTDDQRRIAAAYNELAEGAKKPPRARKARETPPPAPETPPEPSAPVAASVAEARPFPGDAPKQLYPEKAAPVAAAAVPADDKAGFAIAPPLRQGKPDWRTWTIALFLPKVRQAKSTDALAFLIGDNDEHLTAARAVLSKDDLAALNGAIEQRFQELDNAD